MSLQIRIPLGAGVKYECLNEKCFAFEHWFSVQELVWKHFWNEKLADLDLLPYCPMCEKVVTCTDVIDDDFDAPVFVENLRT